MDRKLSVLLLVIVIGFPVYSRAQSASGIISASRMTNWSSAGIPGGIPNRTSICATIDASTYGNGSSDATAGIQNALNSCSANGVVSLSAGTFLINGSIQIPSNVVLRGAGANQTKLSLMGSGSAAVRFGAGTSPNGSSPLSITGGATQGSTSVTLSTASGISAGMLMVISQTNTSYMTENGEDGACNWCTGGVGGDSGQTVEVTSVIGNTINFRPGLYMDYSPNNPVAFPFRAGAQNAGLENLQLYANNTGYVTNLMMKGVKYSWVKGVESNFADGSQFQISWSMGNNIENSYFHDGFNHGAGTNDDTMIIRYKSSANVVTNNIFYRLAPSVMLEWGASGNVISYNYISGGYIDASLNWMIAGIDTHGAHPMFNLLEGNISPNIEPDATWGSSSHNTLLRNWLLGSDQYVPPRDARGPLQFSSATWQDANNIGALIDYTSSYYNLVGNVVGSPHLDSLHPSSDFNYGTPSTGFNGPGCYRFGYSSSGSFKSSTPWNTGFLHGNYGCASKTIQWASGVSQSLPASFYLSSQPGFWKTPWGTPPWPAIGPDVRGGNGPGGYAYDIPAKLCFDNSSQTGGILDFNAKSCYSSSPAPTAPTGLGAVAH